MEKTMLMKLLTKKPPKIHDAMSASESPPAALTERMIATGPVHEKRNATTAAAAYAPPKSASTRRGPGTGSSGRSSGISSRIFQTARGLKSADGAPGSHPKVFQLRAAARGGGARRVRAASRRARAKRVRGPALRAAGAHLRTAARDARGLAHSAGRRRGRAARPWLSRRAARRPGGLVPAQGQRAR